MKSKRHIEQLEILVEHDARRISELTETVDKCLKIIDKQADEIAALNTRCTKIESKNDILELSIEKVKGCKDGGYILPSEPTC